MQILNYPNFGIEAAILQNDSERVKCPFYEIALLFCWKLNG